MSPNIMSEIFQLRESTHYHLRHTSQFMAHPIHGVYNGSESASYLGPEIPLTKFSVVGSQNAKITLSDIFLGVLL